MAANSDLPHNLMAFVSDPVSEQVILNSIKDMGLAYAEVVQGGVNDIIEFLKNNKTPKVLLMDISNSELPIGDIVKIREYAAPNINLLIIGSRNDVGLFRDLMNLDVCDYIVKPLNVNLVVKSLRDALNGTRKNFVEKTGKMIYCISSVGGAGATTVASNLAWIVANRYFKKTALIDMDFLFGTANLMLDIKTENAYLDILESSDKIDDYFIETILKKYGKRLYYLGGLVDLVRGIVVDKEAFEALMQMTKKQFNYLFVDAQRDFGETNRACMRTADNFMIIVEMSVASAQNTARLIEFLTTDQPGKHVTLIANKMGLSSNGALSKESFEKVIDRPIDYMMPFDDATVLASANLGQPLASSGGPLTEVLDDIVQDILGKRDHNEIVKTVLDKEPNSMKFKRMAFEVVDKIVSFIKK